MATIEVQGVSYPVPESFTYKELSTIKKVAGVRAGEIVEAMDAGDVDVIVALAVIVMERAGLKPDVEKLFALDADQITSLDDEEDEGDVVPLPAAVEGPQPSAPPTLTAIQPDTLAASGAQG